MSSLVLLLLLTPALQGVTVPPAQTLAVTAQPRLQSSVALRRSPRVVTYHVETRGRLRADVGVFKRRAVATYRHRLGWERAGIRFRQVSRGGDFTLVLAEASRVPSFSSSCSSEWSCRVGRYVVINETRWLRATPLWRRHGGTLKGYRHLVINHETGHWLGLGHRGCPGRGALAPVMQTQSKGLDGCRVNPFPRAGEIAEAR